MLPRGFYQVTMIDLDSSNPIDIPLQQPMDSQQLGDGSNEKNQSQNISVTFLRIAF